MEYTVSREQFELLRRIEQILQDGLNVRVTTGKDGITVYSEKTKKVSIKCETNT